MNTAVFGKDAFVEMFRAIGLDDATMKRWHVEFESRWPEAHQSFLAWLSLPPDEIARVRAASTRSQGT